MNSPISTCQTVADAVGDIILLDDIPLTLIIDEYNLRALPAYPTTFIATLSGRKLTTALRTIVLAFYITGGKEIPREHQLSYVVVSIDHDSALLAGTGSGKTLTIALLIHLAGIKFVTVTVSPLKRLQIAQVLDIYKSDSTTTNTVIMQAEDFHIKYKIPTLVINDDTPRTREFWKVRERFLCLYTC